MTASTIAEGSISKDGYDGSRASDETDIGVNFKKKTLPLVGEFHSTRSDIDVCEDVPGVL